MRSDSLPENLGLLPRAAASRFRERPALIDMMPDGERHVSFMRFADGCDRMAEALLSRGVNSGARVVVVGDNRLEFVEAIFGALRAGLVAVPVDERVGARTMDSICKSCRPAAIIAIGHDAAATAIAASAMVPIRITAGSPSADWESYHSMRDGADGSSFDARAPVALPGRAPAIVMHTSGSTGFPKGVTLSHQAAMSGLRRNDPRGSDGEIRDIRQRSLLSLPLGHEAAFSAMKYMLAYGGTTILGNRFRAPEFLHLLAKYRCTHTLLVPAMAIMLLKETELLRALDLSALQSIVIGSAACSPELLRSLIEAFPTAVITQNYGLTECGQVFAQSYTRSGRVPLATVGRPVRGVEVRLAGGDDGELYVKSPAMMSGLLNTASPDSGLGDGWLKTGDMFSKDQNGYFYYHGRKDDMFSCGGMNVFPLEVETILCRHPDVLGACVVAMPHHIKGHVPAAMVVLKPGTTLSSDALLRFYLESGAAYARPRRICIVNEMPTGATGKTDRAAIQKTMESVPIDESGL